MIVNTGDTTQLTWEALDEAGDPVPAGSVTATLRAPDGTTSTLAHSVVAPGVYMVAVPTLLPGDYLLIWASTGPAQSDEIAIHARPVGHSAPWEPTLRTVGAHVPDRTREVYAENRESGTFSENTSPDADAVTVLIGTAVARVTSIVGTPIMQAAYPICGTAAALWAAYFVERSYPPEGSQAASLKADADAATAAAKAFNSGLGGGTDQQPDPDGIPDQLCTWGGFDPVIDFPIPGTTAGRSGRIIL